MRPLGLIRNLRNLYRSARRHHHHRRHNPAATEAGTSPPASPTIDLAQLAIEEAKMAAQGAWEDGGSLPVVWAAARDVLAEYETEAGSGGGDGSGRRLWTDQEKQQAETSIEVFVVALCRIQRRKKQP